MGVDAVLPTLSGVWTSLPGGIEQASQYSEGGYDPSAPEHEMTPEEAEMAAGKLVEIGAPPEVAGGFAQAFASPTTGDSENYRRNISMLSFEFPEFIEEQQNTIAAIQDMDNAKYRQTAKMLKDKIRQKIQSGGTFDAEMEQLIVGLATMEGDVSPLLNYFKSKRPDGNKMGPKWDNPAELLSDKKTSFLATQINADPTRYGLTEDQWKGMDKDVQLALAAEMLGKTVENMVGSEEGGYGQGWPRHRDLLLETQRYMQTLGASQQEQEATAQQPIASGQLIDWNSM
jgi:hypothetical protein